MAPRLVLRALLRAGARHADPGEFTKRAFINGKMDLLQAEAVADIVGAQSEMALHLANRQLAGSLSGRIGAIHDAVADLLAEVESRMDFPEEDLQWMPPEQMLAGVANARSAIAALLRTKRDGEVLREGIRLVIAGAPNVGKSSLLNAILGRDRAIVTDIPGTTRDTLEELAHVRGIPVRLVDTAGIREAVDEIERSGVERARASVRQAQVVLWVYDAATDGAPAAEPLGECGAPVVMVANKSDLLAADGAATIPADHVAVSAREGTGLESLFDRIEEVVWDRPHASEPECAVSVRHGSLLEQADASLADARSSLEREEWELAAVALRAALDDTGRITGRTVAHDVLEDIFARFCIGK
jgi:tRNA modification GTPase